MTEDNANHPITNVAPINNIYARYIYMKYRHEVKDKKWKIGQNGLIELVFLSHV